VRVGGGGGLWPCQGGPKKTMSIAMILGMYLPVWGVHPVGAGSIQPGGAIAGGLRACDDSRYGVRDGRLDAHSPALLEAHSGDIGGHEPFPPRGRRTPAGR